MDTQTPSDSSLLAVAPYQPLVKILTVAGLVLGLTINVRGQQSPSASRDDHVIVLELLKRVADLEERVRQLQSKRSETTGSRATAPAITVTPISGDHQSGQPQTSADAQQASSAASSNAIQGKDEPRAEEPPGGHSMELPGGGPALKIRGFLDFNLGLGTDANPLIYPLERMPHSSFQLGELDLFMTSKLSDTVSFLSEVIIGSDATNAWGIDIERAELTYKPSDYFQISAGRFHTSIGFYNTAFHHGAWFQTATGRPFMYFFEDSGGILPVHTVGITTTGLLPHTGKLNLHWIAEAGNGTSGSFIGQSTASEPVQNFLSDKNRKAFNLAGYIKPDWVPGLQIGASHYSDILVPAGAPHVNRNIESAYLVYITPVWEFLNEFALQRGRSIGSGVTFNTPLGYTQISRKFGKYRPYLRWQEVNVPSGDPLFASVGRYEGPSLGLRMDFTDYAALKVQYNRLYTRDALPKNGVDTQVAFTF